MQNCQACLKKNLWSNTGKRDKSGAIIRKCTNCGHLQAEPVPQGLRIPKRVLYYDIETSMMTMEIETFQLNQYNPWLKWEDIKKPPFMICWSAVWIENGKVGKVMGESVTSAGARRGNDKQCVKKLWKLLNQADYIVGHNSKAFDTKKSHLRFLLNDLPSPDLSVKQVDTLALAKKYFKNDSNSLGYWLHCFGEVGKDEMEMDDWHKCKRGDQKTLDKMLKYCKHDVLRGAKVLLRFQKYIESGGVRLFK